MQWNKVFIGGITALSIALTPTLPAEEVLDGELSTEQEFVPPPSPNQSEATQNSKGHKTLKTIGIVLGFAASMTVGLILSSHNTGKRAPGNS